MDQFKISYKWREDKNVINNPFQHDYQMITAADQASAERRFKNIWLGSPDSEVVIKSIERV